MTSEEMTFDEWMTIGITRGWCGPPVCHTHDGVPASAEEDEQWNEGDDPCIHIVRMYEDEQQKLAVEENHSPSSWRNHYTGPRGSIS